jgi:hypothetical protein
MPRHVFSARLAPTLTRQPACRPPDAPELTDGRRAAREGEWAQSRRTRLGHDFRQRSRLSLTLDLQVICVPLLVTPRAPSVEQNAPG